MLLWHFFVGILSMGLMILGADMASGQSYPNKTIRIVTAGIGGGGDFAARLVAQEISGPLGQPVIVENRGSSFMIGESVSKASPDGYTLLLAGTGLWISPLLQKAPYDVARDFSPITLATSSPNLLVLHPSLPVKSVKQLIALAKATPGELSYAAAATGSAAHLAGELFKSMAGVNIAAIPYKGAGAALNDVIGGQVQLMFVNAAGGAPHAKSGRLNALAVTSAQPSALFPALPTIAASGLPGYEAVGLQGILAPAKTPEVIIKRLNLELVRILARADVKEKFLSGGADTVGSSPKEFGAAIKSETAKIGKLIKDAGIKTN